MPPTLSRSSQLPPPPPPDLPNSTTKISKRHKGAPFQKRPRRSADESCCRGTLGCNGGDGRRHDKWCHGTPKKGKRIKNAKETDASECAEALAALQDAEAVETAVVGKEAIVAAAGDTSSSTEVEIVVGALKEPCEGVTGEEGVASLPAQLSPAGAQQLVVVDAVSPSAQRLPVGAPAPASAAPQLMVSSSLSESNPPTFIPASSFFVLKPPPAEPGHRPTSHVDKKRKAEERVFSFCEDANL